jgi:hypothetical protein
VSAEQEVIEARIEHTEEDAVHERQYETVTKIMQALRDNGYDPTPPLEAIEKHQGSAMQTEECDGQDVPPAAATS